MTDNLRNTVAKALREIDNLDTAHRAEGMIGLLMTIWEAVRTEEPFPDGENLRALMLDMSSAASPEDIVACILGFRPKS